MARFLIALLFFPLRALVFFIGFIAYWMEVAADWLIGARNRTEYVCEGSCRRCGRCCRLLAFIMPRFVSKRGWLKTVVRAWHSSILNFEPAGETEEMLVYRCRYYIEGEAGAGVACGCRIYPFRHRLCRFFPRQSLYGRPDLHDDCGFRFIRRDVLKRRSDLTHKGKPLFGDMLHK